MIRRTAMLAVAMGIGACVSGCQPMLFRNDHRIDISAPANLSTVAQPVTLRWSAQGFAAPASGSYAVFVDRNPMPPGETVSWFDPATRGHNIYVVSDTTLTLAQLPDSAGATDFERHHHDVTVVLLDPSGHRVGESAGYAEFSVQ